MREERVSSRILFVFKGIKFALSATTLSDPENWSGIVHFGEGRD